MDIQERIKEINDLIEKLERERTTLLNTLKDVEIPFEEKFKIWAESGKKAHSRWMPSVKEYPAIGNYAHDEMDLQRHRTVDLLDHFQDDFYFLFGVNVHEDDYGPGYEEDKADYLSSIEPGRIELLTSIAKEMMETNLKSFTCDW